jgi:hypothetical protein
MRPVHFALIMALRSSKASSQPMAGSSGESSGLLALTCRLSNPTEAVRGMEVYAYH